MNSDNPINIKDFNSLKKVLVNTEINTNDILISLDVQCLYTNVDAEMALQIIDSKWHIIKKYSLAMGNPFSGILANFTLDYIIDEALKLTTDKPIFIMKYIDDIICTIAQEHVNGLLDAFNRIISKLQFTV